MQIARLVLLMLWYQIPSQRTFPRLRQVCQKLLSVFKPPLHPAARNFKLPIHRQIGKPPAHNFPARTVQNARWCNRLQPRVDRLPCDGCRPRNLRRREKVIDLNFHIPLAVSELPLRSW